MDRSRREGPCRRIRGGEGQLQQLGRTPAFPGGAAKKPHFGCNTAPGLFAWGAGAPEQETNSQVYGRLGPRGGGGRRWANTRRPPQSPVLDSARGGAGRAVTRLHVGVRQGRIGTLTPSGAPAPVPGEAWPPGPVSKRQRGGGARQAATTPRRQHPAGEQRMLSSFPCYEFCTFSLLSLHVEGQFPKKSRLVRKKMEGEGGKERGTGEETGPE